MYKAANCTLTSQQPPSFSDFFFLNMTELHWQTKTKNKQYVTCRTFMLHRSMHPGRGGKVTWVQCLNLTTCYIVMHVDIRWYTLWRWCLGIYMASWQHSPLLTFCLWLLQILKFWATGCPYVPTGFRELSIIIPPSVSIGSSHWFMTLMATLKVFWDFVHFPPIECKYILAWDSEILRGRTVWMGILIHFLHSRIIRVKQFWPHCRLCGPGVRSSQ